MDNAGSSIKRLVVALVALALVMVGCGSSDDGLTTAEESDGGTDVASPAAESNSESPAADTEPEAPAETQDIAVGALPLFSQAGIFVAEDAGFFADEGLSLTREAGAGSSVFIPKLVNGELEVAWLDPMSALLALTRGIDLRIVAPGADKPDPVPDGTFYTPLSVVAGSPITEAGDLEGRTVAVNVLGTILEVSTRKALQNAGVDDSQVNFTEIPFDAMIPALEGGQVDAAVLVDPFYTRNRDGVVPILDAVQGFPQLPFGAWFGTAQFMEENPDKAAAFRSAILQGNEEANNNDDLLYSVMSEAMQAPAEVISEWGRPHFATDVDLDAFVALQEAADAQGLLTGEDVDVRILGGE